MQNFRGFASWSCWVFRAHLQTPGFFLASSPHYGVGLATRPVRKRYTQKQDSYGPDWDIFFPDILKNA